LEPFLALKDGNISVGLYFDNVVFFLDNIESLVEVGESPVIEER
jgi:hypothetical protein